MQEHDSEIAMGRRILVLDGIGGVPLAREIRQAFEDVGANASHYDCAGLERIPFYKLRAGAYKLLNKWEGMDEFVHLPRVHPDVIEEIIKKEQPEAILVVGFIYKFIEPRWLRRLANQYGCGLYLYDTDSCNLYTKRREFTFFLEKELSVYDGIFSFSKVTTDFFQRAKNLNAHYLPFGASITSLPVGVAESRDVLFVGSGDLRRILLLESIAEHVSVFGDRWARNYPLISDRLKQRIVDRPVWGSELHQLMAESKIILNITRGPFYAAETGVNLRIFEALAAGKFLLTDHCDEINELFKVGVEVETFSGSAELRDKVHYYLKHEDKRLEIARRGYERFLQEFTWQKRVSILYEYICAANSKSC